MHISSHVVHVDPRVLPKTRAAIDAIEGLETHAASNDGRVVVTIEADSEATSLDLVGQMSALPGVLAVAMVFHQFEPHPEQEV